MAVQRRVIMTNRPQGMVQESDFRLEEAPIPQPKDGEFLVRVIYLSVDPYMRGRMNDRPSYVPPVKLNEVMCGNGVGVILESTHPEYPAGTYVEGPFHWQEYAVSDGQGVRRIDKELAPISTALGVLGMPGRTAYFGLLDIGQPQTGETVFVSGAAGVVGSTVGQIARIHGCRVVGVAGSDDKVKYLTQELGFDAAFNYKTEKNYHAKIKEMCPHGIDIYFDNVGGPVTDEVFHHINNRARICVCGQISGYNSDKIEMGERIFWRLIVKRARVEGFLVFDYASKYPDADRQLANWFQGGKLKYREHLHHGIENAPKAMIGLFHGENIGKQLVKISDE